MKKSVWVGDIYLPEGERKVFQRIIINRFPDLNMTIENIRNHLCRSVYDENIRCFWEGDLEILLNVNDQRIKVNDHDQENNVNSVVVLNNGNVYTFQGIAPIIVRAKDNTFNTFLRLKITELS